MKIGKHSVTFLFHYNHTRIGEIPSHSPKTFSSPFIKSLSFSPFSSSRLDPPPAPSSSITPSSLLNHRHHHHHHHLPPPLFLYSFLCFPCAPSSPWCVHPFKFSSSVYSPPMTSLPSPKPCAPSPSPGSIPIGN